MTYDEALDKVCLEKHNHYWVMNFRRSTKEIIEIMNEAAELYARSKWDEACDEQRDHCVNQFINSPDVKVNQYSAREYCANAPKPEFK